MLYKPDTEKAASSVFDLTSFNIDNFREKLIAWFKSNKRDLPWRKTNNWYPVFLSEFLLQQTQVDQALPYYKKFLKQFPDILSLSKATEQEVLKLWAGLGYYSRARNMLKAAIRICDDFDGQFPESYIDAVSLPGIGDYTASAILSIAFDKLLPVVDGNVQRVITRIFAVPDDIRLGKTNKMIQEICTELLDPINPGNFNEGIMELGAVICIPKNPQCEKCPVSNHCTAYLSQSIQRFPYKSPPTPKKIWYHLVIVPRFHKEILIVKRRSSGLLASLWEFPVVEVKDLDINVNEINDLIEKKYNLRGKIKRTGKRMNHVYTHIRLQYIPVLYELTRKITPELNDYTDFSWVNFEELNNYPIHNAHKKIIEWINV
jgi:A/G-specific adenine glycosylase